MSRMFIPLFALFVMQVEARTIHAQSITHDTYNVFESPTGSGNWYVNPKGPYTLAPGHTIDKIRVELNHVPTAGQSSSVSVVDPSNTGMVGGVDKWLPGQFGPLPSTPPGNTLRCLAILYYYDGGGVRRSAQGEKTLTSIP